MHIFIYGRTGKDNLSGSKFIFIHKDRKINNKDQTITKYKIAEIKKILEIRLNTEFQGLHMVTRNID